MRAPFSSLVALALLVASCNIEVPDKLPPDGTTDTPTDPSSDFTPGKVDILILMDDTMSMLEEQGFFGTTFPEIVTHLVSGTDPFSAEPFHYRVDDLHVGFISTDMGAGEAGSRVPTCEEVGGDGGVLQHEPDSENPSCDATYPTFLGYESATLDGTALEEMAVGVNCLSPVGLDGCSYEQHFKAITYALVHNRNTSNAGFLRDDSLLVIIVVSDEEDCSSTDDVLYDPDRQDDLGPLYNRCWLHQEYLESVDTFADTLRGLRTEDGIVLAFIVGVPQNPLCEGIGTALGGCLSLDEMEEKYNAGGTEQQTSCDTDNGVAYPPRRFVELAQDFGNSAIVRSICTSDFVPAMEQITQVIQGRVDDIGL